MSGRLVVKQLGLQPYEPIWRAMRDYTDQRTPASPDQLWLLQHPPVFTLGQAGKPEHLLHPGKIPVIHTDRGGQVTYHGPGQLVAYLLLDLRRANLGIRALVTQLEQSVISLLADYGIPATLQAQCPRCLRGRSEDRFGRSARTAWLQFAWLEPECGHGSGSLSAASIPAATLACW